MRRRNSLVLGHNWQVHNKSAEQKTWLPCSSEERIVDLGSPKKSCLLKGRILNPSREDMALQWRGQ